MDTLDSLLNEIESEILRAKKATFSNTDVVVNRQSMLNLLTRLRAAYPVVVREAEQIKKDRDEILSKAEAYANDTMDKAEERARQMMNETEIIKQATLDAEEMRNEAEEAYRKMDYESRSLAFNVLDSAEKVMRESMSLINERKRKLIEE